MVIPEVEPVGFFPTEQLKAQLAELHRPWPSDYDENKHEEMRRQAIRGWMVEHAELLQRALNGTAFQILDSSKPFNPLQLGIEISRKSARRDGFEMILNLARYNKLIPIYRGFTTIGSEEVGWEFRYRSPFKATRINAEKAMSEDGKFYTLDILPEGQGLVFRGFLSDRDATYMDSLGNITRIIHKLRSPFEL